MTHPFEAAIALAPQGEGVMQGATSPAYANFIGPYGGITAAQVVNAVLSKHNFILLGLRGQAKTRMLRALTSLLDEQIPVMPGCDIHDDPRAPICAACRAAIAAHGDTTPIAWLARDRRDNFRRQPAGATRQVHCDPDAVFQPEWPGQAGSCAPHADLPAQ